MKPIYILGINESHNATACLLKDGEIVGCVSEERFCRRKNVYGFPGGSVEWLLKENGVVATEIDQVVLSFQNPILLFHNAELSAGKMSGISKLFPLLKTIADALIYRIPPLYSVYRFLYDRVFKRFFWKKMCLRQEEYISEKMGISASKITRANHHLCHALSVYYGFPHDKDAENLIVTLDGIGDDSCATVMRARGGTVELVAKTPNGASPGMLYAFVTDYMGMKMGEHEYKVMGMSPYSSKHEVEKARKLLDGIFTLTPDLTFKSKLPDTLLGKYLKDLLYKQRFDGIAGAVQGVMEDLLCRYVEMAVRSSGIEKVFCSGGVFMNVKANKAVLELPAVKSAYFMPSSGDESTAIGAAYYGYVDWCAREGFSVPEPRPIKDLYLGISYSGGDVEKMIKERRLEDKYNIYRVDEPEKMVAKLLAEHQIVARFKGRMEFGARALGNRSILANPTRYSAVRILNDQIKSRDFWMPFAGTVLEERFNDYLIPLKETDRSSMMVAFDTTELARKELTAAVHPYDYTMRAQVLTKDYNPEYHALISEFQRLTGVGGVLNTSFNLHGEPMVCSPVDALHTLADSGLEILAIENFIISKKPLR